jgi:hypothetical protein
MARRDELNADYEKGGSNVWTFSGPHLPKE